MRLACRNGTGIPQRREPLMAIARCSVDDYEEMIRVGLLMEKDRVELIRGQIVAKARIGPGNATCVRGLSRLFVTRVDDAAIVGVRDPIRLPDSEPEPDVSLLRPCADCYASGHPRPPDVWLVIAVADSVQDDAWNVRRPLYAESGIPEFWIVNLVDDCLEVYRDPQPDGTYRDTRILHRGQRTDIAALPGVVIAVDEVL
jgi:Uma2 family endonuclease